ncbi:zinc-binding dehydrogenase [Mesorhizobium cantuariense]|uniref:Zinc-binding dehydrogenase n=1 Tax=Mesorhizobium cantuariense TaxID=1300275 RepID=A0ABV7MFQ3_9HYPH
MMLKGLTAEYLVRRTYQVSPGDRILVHAAAGGVGQILCQWAAQIGAKVIGTVGSTAKREIAERLGCARVIVTEEEDFVAVTRAETGGEGVAVVYDGIGADTFEGSLRCARVRGLVVAFGAASGPIPKLDVQSLAGLGSLYVTRPGIDAYTRTSEELREAADALFTMVRSGCVRIAPPRTYPLAEAAQAHADLEGRRTTGSVVLLP